MRIFLTGSTGFIGNALVWKLVELGYNLNVLCRPGSDRGFLKHPQISVFSGDITEFASIAPAIKGCEAVFHLAALAKNWARDKDLYNHINVQGTKNILEQSLQNTIRKIVVTSTCMTFGPSNEHPTDESTPSSAVGFTDYDRTKKITEDVIQHYVQAGLDISVVNPTRVFGPGKLTEGNSVTTMIDLYLKGKWHLIPGDGRAIGNYAFIDDIVNGHIAAFRRGRPGEKYIIGGANLSYTQFFQRLKKISGCFYWMVQIPAPVVKFFSHLEMFRTKISDHYPLITPAWAELFMLDWAYSSKKAQKELAYQITPFDSALQKTISWLQNR
jgi:nucleoside-diphosphate-sugar epimerase